MMSSLIIDAKLTMEEVIKELAQISRRHTQDEDDAAKAHKGDVDNA